MANAVARCQTWARHYLAGLMLTAALVVAPPEGQLKNRPAIVRLLDRREGDRFDPRELVDSGVVLTMPQAEAECGSDAPGHRWTSLN
jgi:hypothetical protein